MKEVVLSERGKNKTTGKYKKGQKKEKRVGQIKKNIARRDDDR